MGRFKGSVHGMGGLKQSKGSVHGMGRLKQSKGSVQSFSGSEVKCMLGFISTT